MKVITSYRYHNILTYSHKQGMTWHLLTIFHSKRSVLLELETILHSNEKLPNYINKTKAVSEDEPDTQGFSLISSKGSVYLVFSHQNKFAHLQIVLNG